MPAADVAASPQVQTFLRSPQAAPMHLVIGTSINNARRAASSIQAGNIRCKYSVTVTSGGTGRNAYITVTKTKAYHDALEKIYNEKMKSVPALQRELEELQRRQQRDLAGVERIVVQRVSVPGVQTGRSAQSPAADMPDPKRARVTPSHLLATAPAAVSSSSSSSSTPVSAVTGFGRPPTLPRPVGAASVGFQRAAVPMTANRAPETATPIAQKPIAVIDLTL